MGILTITTKVKFRVDDISRLGFEDAQFVAGANDKITRRTRDAMPENDRLRAAITSSIEFLELGEKQKALKLLDDSIADANQEGRVGWVVALSHHAAILCRHTGDLQLAKRYYEQSLSSEPENPRALYGLAYVALEQGETELARQYAEKSYKALMQCDDEIVKQGLLDLILKNWPDLAVC